MEEGIQAVAQCEAGHLKSGYTLVPEKRKEKAMKFDDNDIQGRFPIRMADDFGTKPTIWLWWGRSLHEAVFLGYTTWEDEYILLLYSAIK